MRDRSTVLTAQASSRRWAHSRLARVQHPHLAQGAVPLVAPPRGFQQSARADQHVCGPVSHRCDSSPRTSAGRSQHRHVCGLVSHRCDSSPRTSAGRSQRGHVRRFPPARPCGNRLTPDDADFHIRRRVTTRRLLLCAAGEPLLASMVGTASAEPLLNCSTEVVLSWKEIRELNRARSGPRSLSAAVFERDRLTLRWLVGPEQHRRLPAICTLDSMPEPLHVPHLKRRIDREQVELCHEVADHAAIGP